MSRVKKVKTARPKAVTIARKDRGGDYSDVLDVAGLLKRKYGSAVNAFVEVFRKSEDYAETYPKLPKNKPDSK